jgi:hypothetical protein
MKGSRHVVKSQISSNTPGDSADSICQQTCVARLSDMKTVATSSRHIEHLVRRCHTINTTKREISRHYASMLRLYCRKTVSNVQQVLHILDSIEAITP